MVALVAWRLQVRFRVVALSCSVTTSLQSKSCSTKPQLLLWRLVVSKNLQTKTQAFVAIYKKPNHLHLCDWNGDCPATSQWIIIFPSWLMVVDWSLGLCVVHLIHSNLQWLSRVPNCGQVNATWLVVTCGQNPNRRPYGNPTNLLYDFQIGYETETRTQSGTIYLRWTHPQWCHLDFHLQLKHWPVTVWVISKKTW